MACLLVLSGSMADRFGRKRIFQLGLSLFSLSSLLCGLAPSVGWLITFRGLQAVGGSMLNPVALSIIVSVFTDRRERARANSSRRSRRASVFPRISSARTTAGTPSPTAGNEPPR